MRQGGNGPLRIINGLLKAAHLHPAQPVLPIHFRYSSGADQVGDKAHDFCELCVHSDIMVKYSTI